MSKEKPNDNPEKEANIADNLADDASKEQVNEFVPEDDAVENSEETDNVSEKLAKLNDAYLRLMAEYDNYRKRTFKEKTELIKNGGEKALTGLLPVVDDFERAMQTIETASDISAIKEGIELIYNKFQSYLQQNSVKPIEAVGREFDPDLDEAIATVPATDEAQKGLIIDNIQTGYTLNDKVIRHAKVVVAN
jgi:molecular chaperone GrpE